MVRAADHQESEEYVLPFFTCRQCGSRSVEYIAAIMTEDVTESSLPCRCGAADVALTRTVTRSMHIQGSGHVLKDRQPHEEERDILDEEIEEEHGPVECQRCVNLFAGREDLWDVEEVSTTDEGDRDLTLHCGGCRREIEFGYSHESKQGRLWLDQDDRDFNPWKCFPDPRYREAWEARGWTRPQK
jgi:hypothetical protein